MFPTGTPTGYRQTATATCRIKPRQNFRMEVTLTGNGRAFEAGKDSGMIRVNGISIAEVHSSGGGTICALPTNTKLASFQEMPVSIILRGQREYILKVEFDSWDNYVVPGTFFDAIFKFFPTDEEPSPILGVPECGHPEKVKVIVEAVVDLKENYLCHGWIVDGQVSGELESAIHINAGAGSLFSFPFPLTCKGEESMPSLRTLVALTYPNDASCNLLLSLQAKIEGAIPCAGVDCSRNRPTYTTSILLPYGDLFGVYEIEAVDAAGVDWRFKITIAASS